MTVEQRIETIERSLRRWRKAAITLCALLVVAGTMAASRQEEIPDVIKTRSLEVVNKDGEVVVAAHAQKNGAGILQVFHEPGDSPGVEIPHYMNVGRITVGTAAHQDRCMC